MLKFYVNIIMYKYALANKATKVSKLFIMKYIGGHNYMLLEIILQG
ncbi:hypothetical protein NLO413_0948 [Candidatus Neoehrlichia lotoris str. RAC413]|uniref:Uncharacterized protein n=1 Tax=Candidatus Neoehrlichia procyonis str. RAC413 TaxID=1359163 RepID=A0A0F3NND8_9RICK|nr:hypothetical protein NLO413_0948 [Candidatus Neoehrlichia lotoris str. RAC413]